MSKQAKNAGRETASPSREERLQTIGRELIELEESTRKEISRRLHDEAGQSLACIRLQTEMLQFAGTSVEQIQEALKEIQELTERSIREVRALIAELSPRVLEQSGLAAAVQQFTTRLHADTASVISLNLGDLSSLGRPVQVVLYRTIQDAASALTKHFLAQKLNISLEVSDGVVRLDMDGSSENQPRVQEKSAENPLLKAARNRVEVLGGSWSFLGPAAVPNKAAKGSRSSGQLAVELPVS